MEFCLYLLEKMLAPGCAKRRFLKDGQTETVTLENTREFEERLKALLERGG